MKKFLCVVCVLLAFAFVFVGCNPDGPTDNSASSDTTTYTLSATPSILSIDVGATGEITVTTNGTFSVSVDESIAKATKNDNKITVEGVSAGDATLTITCNEDKSKTAIVGVNVNATTVKVTFDYSKLTDKDKVASATIKYGNEDYTNENGEKVGKFKEVNATVDTINYTVSADFELLYTNNDGWFNKTEIKLKDSDGNEVAPIHMLSTEYFKVSGDKLVDNSGNTVELKINDASSITLTINLNNFTGVTKVTVAYSNTEFTDLTNLTEEEANLNSEKTVATIQIDPSKAGTAWFDSVIRVYGAENTVLQDNHPSDWLKYEPTGITVNLTYVDPNVTATELKKDVEYTGETEGESNKFVQLVTNSELQDLEITSLIIEFKEADWSNTTGNWYINVYSAAGWGNDETQLKWVSNDYYKVEITDSTVISAYKSNGIYVTGLVGVTGKITVSYK